MGYYLIDRKAQVLGLPFPNFKAEIENPVSSEDTRRLKDSGAIVVQQDTKDPGRDEQDIHGKNESPYCPVAHVDQAWPRPLFLLKWSS